MAYSYDDLYRLYTGQGGAAPGSGTPGPMAPMDAYGVEGTTEPTEPTTPSYELSPDPLVPSAPMGGNALQGGLEAPEAPPVLSVKNGQSSGWSTSSGRNGVNMDTVQKYGDRFDKKLGATQDASRAAVASNYDSVQEALDIAKQRATNAAELGTEAKLQEISDAQATATHLGAIQQQFQKDEIDIRARDTAALNKRIGEYQTSLADFAASKVDPQDFWHSQSGGMRFGSMVSAFVHDFLGAKGIKTSAMDTFSKAIDRNINAQIQNINKKGEVAKGFKTLYDMESAKSASDAETRLRIRGYMLEAAKQHVIANMSSYKSMLANAEGQKAMAEVDGEYAKNLSQLVQKMTDDQNARTQQDLQWAMHKGQMAMEGARIAQARRDSSLAERKFNYEREQNDKKNRAEAIGNFIPDVTESGKGDMGWEFRPGISKEKKDETLGKVEGYGNQVRNVAEYREMIRKYDSIKDPTERKLFADTNSSKMASLQTKIFLDDVLRRTGKAATEQERTQIKSRIPLNDWQAMNKSTDVLAAQFEKDGIEDMNTALGTVSYKLTPEQSKALRDQGIHGFTGRTGGFGKGEYAESKSTMENHDAPSSITDKAQKLIGTPNGKLNEDYLQGTGFTKDDVDLDFQANTGAKTTNGKMRSDWEGGGWDPDGLKDREAPGWAAGVLLLGEKAKDGASREGQAAKATLEKMVNTPWAEAQKDPLWKDLDRGDYNLMRQYAMSKIKQATPSVPGGLKDADNNPAPTYKNPTKYRHQLGTDPDGNPVYID